MRYSLLMHYAEATEYELGAAAMAEGRAAMTAYTTALDAEGLLVSADVYTPSTSTVTVALHDGGLALQDGPFNDTRVQLGGVFVINVADADAALAWAEKCPAAQWGTVEVRASATWFQNGAWQPAG